MAVWWGSPVKDLPSQGGLNTEMGEVGWERRGMGRGMEGGGGRRGRGEEGEHAEADRVVAASLFHLRISY